MVEPQVDQLTALDVARHIRYSITSRKALSVIRLGDGESRLMGFPAYTSRDALNACLRRWFGHVGFPEDQLLAMAADLRNACANADIIGIPRPDQKTRLKDYNNIEEYLAHYDLIKPGVKFANASLHREMQEQNLYGLFLEDLDVVNVITCRRVADKIKDKFGVCHVEEFLVPGEAKFEDKPVEVHYPDRFEELRKELKLKVCRPAEVFFVGAGPLGKTYCSWIKQRGGVAVDIGSVFDGWAGICTRSYIAARMNLYTLA